jgi:hypothetical protein
MSTTSRAEARIHQPRERHTPGRISAAIVAVVITGFSAWALMTLPLQAAFILVAAAWVAFAAWLKTTYAHPVRSRKVLAIRSMLQETARLKAPPDPQPSPPDRCTGRPDRCRAHPGRYCCAGP